MDKIKQLKNVYKALNNEARIKIMLLCAEKEFNITEICKKIKLGYTTTSEYISMLEKEDLIKKTRKNNQVFIRSQYGILDTGELRKI